MKRVAANKLPLETASLRLRTRFHAKFPSSLLSQTTSAPSPVAAATPSIPVSASLEHLQVARLLLRNRLVAKFPVAATFKLDQCRSHKQEPVCEKALEEAALRRTQDHQESVGTLEALEAVRHCRIQRRVQLKFQPDFTNFPQTVDSASDWSSSDAIVITTAQAPSKFNKAWRELRGFTQTPAFGQTFSSRDSRERVLRGLLNRKLDPRRQTQM